MLFKKKKKTLVDLNRKAIGVLLRFIIRVVLKAAAEAAKAAAAAAALINDDDSRRRTLEGQGESKEQSAVENRTILYGSFSLL